VTDLLLVILILLVLGVVVFLIVLAKRRPVGDAGTEAELRADLQAERDGRVQAETRLEAERKNLAEQRRLLDEAEGKLKDAFAALSAEALKESRQEFLGQAGERLKPIQDLLAEYQKRLAEVEKSGMGAYSGLREYLDGLMKAQDSLRTQTTRLETALRGSPTARGRWGELTLRRLVEMAGMSPFCDFAEQETTTGEEGAVRPDLTVRLPNDRTVVVDSKVSTDAYLEACAATDESARRAALARHAQHVRTHMTGLMRKSYWSRLGNAPDFVVCFIPGESFFAAALEQDRTLIEEGFRSGVVLASPATLFALLKAVEMGWREHQLAENAEKIADVGRDLYERVRVFAENFRDVGSGLRGAAKAYDAAVGSYQSRLEPGARKLAELGASSGKELPEVEGVEGPTRALPEGET